ncbi:hypothetical protein [Streptomyces sp. CB03911]|uniref:hypothetical protein n=1 Tax=Streptomyces sp. CB03911 TaxID=1804758 RepID=UPI00093D6A31|nr:hypothetical protein [Streptomyces sp. CB03911]OKI26767.1 hypothetical protein A6A07_28525 [Streptomyces sp. CB03911]
MPASTAPAASAPQAAAPAAVPQSAVPVAVPPPAVPPPAVPPPAVPPPAVPAASAAAGRRLTALLAAPGRYRTRWLRHVARATPGRVNQAAVARVLAEWLWLGGEASEGDILPRALRDRVSRALGGRALSAATLRLFVAAFDMTAADEARLWDLLDGRPEPGADPGAPAAPVPTAP